MREMYPNPKIQNAIISANASSGFVATTRDGKPLRMALVDEEDNIIEAGDTVRWAAWRICTEALENLWRGQGHLIIHSSPPGVKIPPEAA
ncbi:hypothetical protein [Pseudomonas aeruginosa]|uniref:hypothetical protein n=1 Tax=Pseudomonas aeruginosa TaxID=287 RepID=UPI0009A2A423|nr:hypothetical protein [Pseudomonas aeruginosa]EKZ3178505.1 hypothetical protein [Pseudomonas aeruginosa]EMC2521296.1 hypothetical protein [Pseudomonas aeruginosa]MBG4755111.1 hypothetical protein [Pseudomonas aeruginosa]MBG6401949.1 hypothetical protein [Pseudomonas aeruginosa]MBG6851213.1 hypothetical protein [Pseudomonas aeruginosa]